MGIFSNLFTYLRTTLWKDNESGDITPLALRQGFESFAAIVEQHLVTAQAQENLKSFATGSPDAKSWPITLNNPSNRIGRFMTTSITKKILVLDSDFQLIGTGTNRTLQIIDQNLDKFEVGERLLYVEYERGSALEFEMPIVSIRTVAGAKKFMWKFPSEDDSAWRLIGDFYLPNAYVTSDITHYDQILGSRPLADALWKITHRGAWIDNTTDWRTLKDGIYIFDLQANQNWNAALGAPVKLGKQGSVHVARDSDGIGSNVVIQVFPWFVTRGIGMAVRMKMKGNDWAASDWQYMRVDSATEYFSQLILGNGANTGENFQLTGTIRINDVDVTKKTITKRINYSRDTWLDLLQTELDSSATYVVSIRINIQYGSYFPCLSALVCTSVPTNSYETLPISFNYNAHAMDNAVPELRWQLVAANQKPKLQFRLTKALDYAEPLDFIITYQRLL